MYAQLKNMEKTGVHQSKQTLVPMEKFKSIIKFKTIPELIDFYSRHLNEVYNFIIY